MLLTKSPTEFYLQKLKEKVYFKIRNKIISLGLEDTKKLANSQGCRKRYIIKTKILKN